MFPQQSSADSLFGSADLESKIAALEEKIMPFPALAVKTTLFFKPGPVKTLEYYFHLLAQAAQDPSAKCDVQEARRILKIAYSRESPEERFYYETAVLAGFYEDVPPDEWMFIKNKIKQAALDGDLNSQINFISAILIDNTPLANSEDKTLAKELLYQSALAGCVDAQFLLGQLFSQGPHDVIPANLLLGIHWLQKAVAQGDVGAHFLLGVCYQELAPLCYRGHRISWQPALKEAIQLFNTAAEKGHCLAKSYATTCQLELNANQGDWVAQYQLAQCYENGTGVAVNLPKALGWYDFARNLAKVQLDSSIETASKVKCEQFSEINEARFVNSSTFFHPGKREKYYRVADLRQIKREQAEDFVNPFVPNKRHNYYFRGSKKITPEELNLQKDALTQHYSSYRNFTVR